MKKRMNLRILLSVIFIFCMMAAVFTACQKEEEPIEITVMDKISEPFDGEAHPVIATASKDGCLSYLYEGIDNKYFSPYAPSQPGEYNVKVTYKASPDSNDSIIKNVKLNIELPFVLDETGCFISEYKGSSENMVIPSTYRDKNIIGFSDHANFHSRYFVSIKAPLTEFYIKGDDNDSNWSQFKASKLYISENTKLRNGFPGTTVEYYDEPRVLKDGAFENVWGIDEFTVPSSVMRIEENALAGLKVSKITLNSDLPLYNKNLSPTIKTVTVAPSSRGRLADEFFKDVKTVEKIEILSGVNIIGNEAFLGCDGLKELTFNTANNWSCIGENCFASGFVLEKVTVPKGFFLFGLGEIEITEAVMTFNGERNLSSTFWACKGLKKAVLPAELKKIEESEFSGCSNLTEVVLPERFEEIGKSAFSGCKSLTSIDLPDTLRYVNDQAFAYCANLEEIKLPDSVEWIGDMAFYKCTKLKTDKLPDNLRYIGNSAFNKNTEFELKNTALPDGLVEIGHQAFVDCNKITELTLPKTVTKIGSNAFAVCFSLKKLYITSEEMPVISENAFYGMSDSCIISVPAKLLGSYKEAFPKVNFSAIENS